MKKITLFLLSFLFEKINTNKTFFKNVFHPLQLIVICLFTIAMITGCESDDDDKDTTTNKSEIYYRWTENLSYPSGSNAAGCNVSVAAYYNNSHPDIPDNAVKNQYYKVSPGSFTVNLSSIGGGSTTKYLNTPATGYRRYYTHTIKKYWPATNRCLIVMSQEDAYTFFDEPIN